MHQSKLITSPDHIYEANIIDFNRLNGSWSHQGQAMDTIFSWLKDAATITIIDIPDYYRAPQRDDFPNWSHTGNHVEEAKFYWNWFYWKHPDGVLKLCDSPDLYGEVCSQFFWGDIGKVSASAFSRCLKYMRMGDLWISVKGNRQVIIEVNISILDRFAAETEESFLEAYRSAHNAGRIVLAEEYR